MKVLLCSTTDAGGGAAIAAHRLLNGLIDAGVDTHMLVKDRATTNKMVLSVYDYWDKNSVFIRLVRFVFEKLKRRSRFNKWNKYPNRQKVTVSDISFSNLRRSIFNLDFDILHLHWVEDEFVDFKDLQKLNKPIVWTLHGCFPFTGICHYFLCDGFFKTRCGRCPVLNSDKQIDFSTELFDLKKKRYKYLDFHIVSPSKWLGEKAKESALLGKSPIFIIPNGIDTHNYSPVNRIIAQNALNISTGKKIILFGAVSALSDDRKGFKLLKDALLVLQSLYSIDEISLLIFGADKTDLSQELKIETTFLGNIAHDRLLVLAYSAADVLVVPSKHENLPNTIMESMSCGTPVTAFDIGGNGDMIDHKNNGYLAKPYDPVDLAEGIKWCLENNTNNQIGIKARNKVLENFAIEDIAMRYLDLYESILRKKTDTVNF